MFSDPRKNLEQFDIAPSMKVADFGSGVGHYTFLLGQMVGSTGHVFAIDIQKELLVTLKREAEKAHLFNVEVVCADFDTGSTKLKSDFIERGIIANVLFQVTEKESFVKEVARVLKVGGKVLVIDWSDSFGGIGPDKKFVISKNECQSIFEKAGFVLEKNIAAGMHHYGFVFKKV